MAVERKRKNPYDRSRLRAQLTFIKGSRRQGVPGIWVVDSGKPGPVVGITLHTHGNEPSGLAVLAYFRESFPLASRLKRGSVVFVLNNIKATERYLRAKTPAQKKSARFIDVNMNRLPLGLERMKKDSRYEIRRARELLPIWRSFDAAIDVHSLSQDSEPFIVSIGRFEKRLVRGFPMRHIVSGMQEVMRDRSAIMFYGRGKIPSLGIETGSHENARSFRCASTCVRTFLENMRMLDSATKFSTRTYEEYKLRGSLWFPDIEYRLARPFRNYEQIGKGELLAKKGDSMIRARFAGHVILPPVGIRPKHINEEVFFLSSPMRTMRLKNKRSDR